MTFPSSGAWKRPGWMLSLCAFPRSLSVSRSLFRQSRALSDRVEVFCPLQWVFSLPSRFLFRLFGRMVYTMGCVNEPTQASNTKTSALYQQIERDKRFMPTQASNSKTKTMNQRERQIPTQTQCINICTLERYIQSASCHGTRGLERDILVFMGTE